MAYGGEPLDRYATGEAPGVVYVVNPSTLSSAGIEPNAGIGFPSRYVFQFDQGLFESLSSAWNAGDAAVLDRFWADAVPLKLPLADVRPVLDEVV
jgi:hypothetical protein